MKTRYLLFALLTAVLAISGGRLAQQPTAAAEPGPATAPVTQAAYLDQYQTSADGLRFTLNVPGWSVDAEGALHAPGLETVTNEPGAPAVPYFSAYIALPPEAEATPVVTAGAVERTAVAQLQPAADIDRAALPAELLEVRRLEDYGLVHEPDADVYGRDALYPEPLYTLSAPLYMRDLRVVELRLYPLRYNPLQGQLEHHSRLDVVLSFSGGRLDNLNPAPIADGRPFGDGLVLNSAQAAGWRSLPAEPSGPASPTALPVGRDVYAVYVDRDGIQTVTYEALQTAGMDVAAVNPNTFQMIYGGNAVAYNPDDSATWSYDYAAKQVAYEFVGDGDNQFEPGEALRFYGWKWDGNRHDRQYVGRNVYLLWAGGTPTRIASTGSNPTGYTQVPRWTSTITFEQDVNFNSTSTSRWPTFENEADAWYWDIFNNAVSGPPITRTHALVIPNPEPTGPQASVTVEVFTLFELNGHRLYTQFNNHTPFDRIWNGINSVKLTQNIPANQIVDGVNTIAMWGASCCTGGGQPLNDRFYFNRVTVRYPRQFRAVDGQLIFSHAPAGDHEFRVGGFTTNQASQFHVWEIGNRLQPRRIPITAADLSGSNPYTVRIGNRQTGPAQYIAAVTTHTPPLISRYNAPNLEPAGNGADWVMITYQPFRGETERLAQHRAAHSGLIVHVVNYHDIMAQYGYGLETPSAIRNYVRHTMTNWTRKPTHLVLGGDATMNHLQRPCPACGGTWNTTDRTYVLTDLLFVDRFQGLVPSDHTFTTVIGNDLLPDLTVGRLTANTVQEMKNIVDKTIAFDTAVQNEAAWTERSLFLADNEDDGGAFCTDNRTIMHYIEGRFGFNPGAAPETLFKLLCLDDYLPLYPTEALARDAMRADIFQRLSNAALSPAMINYRGHGSVTGWAAGLLNVNNAVDMNNVGRPAFILSADCLDGFFAWTGQPSLSETMLRFPNLTGSFAHWSSSGLGFSYEHTKLHSEFYIAVYEQGHDTLGEAAMYSKIAYYLLGAYSDSEMYTFILQGDPAVALPTPGVAVYLPIVVK